ncbi:class I histocompatibility antigen, F10 alpha chain-like isoform X1 [Embiotoca jacksoni]|uniref:class I histocompatibility antigen, F10 alpha chain-like isoform X1 n=2 Tax=Embiotoca jacksoni TaxID=100190 RepID=UPI0037049434
MLVFQLMFVSLFLLQTTSSVSGRHSTWALASSISGSTVFPEFTAVLMLDDIQVGYYDSTMDRAMRVGGGGEKEAELDLGQDDTSVLQFIISSMREKLNWSKQKFNLTGVVVHQMLVGCEVLDGQPVFSMVRDANNRQEVESIMYNMTHFTVAGSNSWEMWLDMSKRMYAQTLFTNFYVPVCVRFLQTLLDREKNLVMRRVRPRVRVLTKQVVGGARVTCLATDFYPRHINLTLLRDGRPVDEDELTGGSVLPNGNGLYQVRKTLTVDDEELRRKHSYTCAASHLSLDNRMEVSWRAEFSRSHRVPVVSVPVAVLLLVLLVVVVLWWRRRRARSDGIAMETQEEEAEDQDRAAAADPATCECPE